MGLRIVNIVIGGAIGALTRYGLSGTVARICGGQFPYGTLVVNWLGCLCMGLCTAFFRKQSWLGSEAQLLVMTGFLGSLTTFSTFAQDSVDLLQNGEYLMVILNIAINTGGGLILVLLGMWLGTVIAV